MSGITQTYNRGYVLDENALQQVPIGASQEQVLLVLGTPSTVATVSGEAFYYISQKTQQTAFLRPQVIDQRVLVVYFSPDRRVTRIANYGLQDGKIFDFISRTTMAGDIPKRLPAVHAFSALPEAAALAAANKRVGNILKNVTNINPFGAGN
ncbi:MAG TPA: outer membrane protein assembly factor BamE [Xanthobacteraceae bacterium]|nr:outer membrane protein assembly factor BamE [Xanthobacteraceae bacterium]